MRFGGLQEELLLCFVNVPVTGILVGLDQLSYVLLVVESRQIEVQLPIAYRHIKVNTYSDWKKYMFCQYLN